MSKKNNAPPPPVQAVKAVRENDKVTPPVDPVDETNEQGFNPGKDVSGPPFEVVKGKSIVCKRGTLLGGDSVTADDLGGGELSLKKLIELDVVTEN